MVLIAKALGLIVLGAVLMLAYVYWLETHPSSNQSSIVCYSGFLPIPIHKGNPDFLRRGAPIDGGVIYRDAKTGKDVVIVNAACVYHE